MMPSATKKMENTSTDLAIRNLRINYRVPGDHPDPTQLQQRLDTPLRSDLPHTLEKYAQNLLQSQGWLFIRDLKIHLTINTAWDQEQIAKVWSSHILDAIYKTKNRGSGYIYFPTYSAYIASFIAGLVAGDSWSKWYFRHFDGLRLLPLSTAVRTLLCNYGSAATNCLTTLDVKTLQRLLSVLTQQDAKQILHTLATNDQQATEVQLMASMELRKSIEEFIISFQKNHHSTLTTAQAALSFYVRIKQKNKKYRGVSLKDLAGALCYLLHYCRVTTDRYAVYLALKYIVEKKLSALYQHDAVLAEHCIPLQNYPTDYLQDIVKAIHTHINAQAVNDVTTVGQESFYSAHGGLIMLAPAVDRLALQTQVRDWPNLDGVSAAHILRWLIVIKTCAVGKYSDLLYDRAAREIYQIPPTISLTDIQTWLQEIELKQWLSLGKALMVREQGFVVLDFKMEKSFAFALFDEVRGRCVYYETRAEQIDEKFTRRMLCRLTRRKISPLRLYVSTELRAVFDGIKDCSIYDLANVDIDNLGIDNRAAAVQVLAKRPLSLAEDFKFLAFPKKPSFFALADNMLSCFAQQVLRDFSHRLPGFAHASLAYLHKNTLHTSIHIKQHENDFDIHIDAPPLNVLLSMTGITRQQFTLSWQNERNYRLYPAS